MTERRNNPNAASAPLDFSRFYSSPASKSEEMHQLLAEIERKCREMKLENSNLTGENPGAVTENPGEVNENPGEVNKNPEEVNENPGEVNENPGKDDKEEEKMEEPLAEKWFHISDAHVSEVSVERVLKCQAYLLFYERTL